VSSPIVVYGATGYTGRLIVREALAKGLKPIIAGRDTTAVREMSVATGLEGRVASLDDADSLDAAFAGAKVVINCAGPFHSRAWPVVDACFRAGIHYLDITGEIVVFERMAALGPKAAAAGISLLPGVGFDVVPSDCLAARLKRRLPSATHLELAFTGGVGLSRGTATTMVEGIARGGAVRRDGKITRVPQAYATRDIDYGHRRLSSMSIPWGDVSTAFHSTGIANIVVYTAVHPKTIRRLRMMRPFAPLLGTRLAQQFLLARAARIKGPNDDKRAAAQSRLWGEARDAAGNVVVSRLVAPEGYDLTAITSVAAAQRVLAGGVRPGFQTPSKAFGEDFILSAPGAAFEDLP
jgi:short subunit dehydrogenase-like uncharacterized protein